MALTQPAVLFFFAFFLPLVLSCTKNYHCDDNDPSTVDHCLHPYHFCISISDIQSSKITQTREADMNLDSSRAKGRTLQSLIDETNQDRLSIPDKQTIINAAAKILKNLNPHRFLHLNVYNVDPVQELVDFNRTITDKQTNHEFHNGMVSIFSLMKDFHTLYIRPPPLTESIATLLFNVAKYFENGKARYIVTDFTNNPSEYSPPSFGKGTEILTYDGEDIEDVVRSFGKRDYGANSAAQAANGVVLLTLRLLSVNSIPTKDSVSVVYRNQDGSSSVADFKWKFIQLRHSKDINALSSTSRPTSVGFPWEQVRIFPDKKRVRRPGGSRYGVNVLDIAAVTPETFEGKIVKTRSGPMGILVIKSFLAAVDTKLIEGLSQILQQMPINGLVVDIRNNLGGNPGYVKALTELISNKDIPVQPTTLRASKLMKEALERLDETFLPRLDRNALSAYREAVKYSFIVGEEFSGPAPDVYDQRLERLKQVYQGPIVTLVNGRTYSAADLYTALHIDQNISTVVGVDDNVGAGGASVMRYSNLTTAAPSLFRKLPGNVDFTTALGRFYRSGAKAGVIVEHFGVGPDIIYQMTRNDVLENDRDLHEFLGKFLKGKRNGRSARKTRRKKERKSRRRRWG